MRKTQSCKISLKDFNPILERKVLERVFDLCVAASCDLNASVFLSYSYCNLIFTSRIADYRVYYHVFIFTIKLTKHRNARDRKRAMMNFPPGYSARHVHV